MSTLIENLSRRRFLHGMMSAGAFVLAVRYAPGVSFAQNVSAANPFQNLPLHPNAFVGIETDGTVHIIASRSEMGTSSRTTVPMIVADELDADWKRVKIEQAIGDAKYGNQDTDGSKSVKDFFQPMRVAGATARLMLLRAAAEQWGVAPGECSTDNHQVVHGPSGRKLDYGQLVAAAAKQPVPQPSELKFKSRDQWRYIGKSANPYDLQDYCTGKAIFGIDAKVEGMVYASIAHPPVLGGTVKHLDDSGARAVKGVQQTVTLNTFTPPCEFQPLGGVAVIADNTWSALQGRKQLKVEWNDGPNAVFDSDTYKQYLLSTARKPGKVWRNEGDVDAVFGIGKAFEGSSENFNKKKIFEADYYIPLLAHVSMEPPMALADVRGSQATVWTSTQNPQQVQASVSSALGIPKENVICHVTLLGGGFGRKSKPDNAVEAAILSKKVGKPVKVFWSREDDIQFGYYHAVAAMHMEAAVDEKGKPTAWLQRSVFPPIGSIFKAGDQYGSAGEMGLGFTDIPYAIPNLRVENGPAPAHVRIGWLRSVANIYHAFAVQTFSDELAANAGRDRVEYLLDLIGPSRTIDLKAMGVNYDNYGASTKEYPLDTGRLRNVVEVAAEKSGWGKEKSGNGVGYGVAVHRSFLTYVAYVVKVEVDHNADIAIRRVDCAVDAGLVANPDRTRSQFEGAAVFGTSIARTSEITARNGVVQQSNFFDYQVARMNEAPYQTNVYLVENDAPPAGVGEPGVPPFVPALCNAIFAATGQRVRELPFSKMDFSKSAKS